ncbi:hypothetical protein BIV60_16170 [Bacillus sp. MUM 116]|uniref:hypothetical protein n=1 Tax=Bacillus sp. MUM 116 TaxID=1678002 RepID=UPI0008F5A5C3|nr:hypothetical protein [Bacillus sp. MUM 116]OIK12435.1 hypothetical protein BIV60_16170 [Bacillus sp. MUM 116]
MYVIASFVHLPQLESAISSLKDKGINNEDLSTIPLKSETGHSFISNIIHQSDKFSIFVVSALLGAILSVIGPSFEYFLKWEQITWDLMIFIISLTICFVSEFVISRKKTKYHNKEKTNIVLIIKCFKSEAHLVEKELYKHSAIEVVLCNKCSQLQFEMEPMRT